MDWYRDIYLQLSTVDVCCLTFYRISYDAGRSKYAI